MNNIMADPYPLELQPHLQKQVDHGVSGTDILHGHLKTLLYEAEQELINAQEQEDLTEEAMDSMERKYWEGQVDALSYVYSMTYALAFAIDERIKARG
jgi:hypothetical protein